MRPPNPFSLDVAPAISLFRRGFTIWIAEIFSFTESIGDKTIDCKGLSPSEKKNREFPLSHAIEGLTKIHWTKYMLRLMCPSQLVGRFFLIF